VTRLFVTPVGTQLPHCPQLDMPSTSCVFFCTCQDADIELLLLARMLHMDRVSCVAIVVTLVTVFLGLSSSAYNPVHVFHNNGVRRNDDTGRFVNCGMILRLRFMLETIELMAIGT